jgi:hypothetical protein
MEVTAMNTRTPAVVGDRFVYRSEHAWNTGIRLHDDRCRLLSHPRAKRCYCPRKLELERTVTVVVVTGVHENGFDYEIARVVSCENAPPTNPLGCLRVGLTGGMTFDNLSREIAAGTMEVAR